MTALPNRDRRAERREATRREVLDVAWELARRGGLAAVTLREIAARMGMRSPSLYSHFDSKSAIYDAMFGEAWTELAAAFDALGPRPANPRKGLLQEARAFFDFSTADLARYQLMNQRTIPGFEPSPESFAPSQRVVARGIQMLGALGITDRGAVEILFSMISGLVDQQHANDPGGTSRRALLVRAVDMWCDGVQLDQKTNATPTEKAGAR